MSIRNGGAATSVAASTVGSSQITDGSIVNADINASAAIAFSKLAAVPASRPSFTVATLANDFTINSASYVSVTGLAVTVTTPAGGEIAIVNILASATGAAGGSVVLAYTLNAGSEVPINADSLTAGFSGTMCSSFPVTLAAGSNIIQVRAIDQGASFPIKIYGTTSGAVLGAAKLMVTQFG